MVLMVTNVALAQTSNRPPIIPTGVTQQLLIPNSAGSGSPEEQYFGGLFLPALTQTVIALSGALAFVFMIVGGIQILTAYGNEERVSAGRKTMMFAVVGLVISMLAYAIVQIISSIQITPPQEGLTSEQMEEKEQVQKQIKEKVDKGELAPGSEDQSLEEMKALL